MAHDFAALHDVLVLDPGLIASLSAGQRTAGLASADTLMALLAQTISDLHLNDDGVITADDLAAVSAAIQGDGGLYATFAAAHGDDAGGVETGYHQLQNDGGTLLFQGRNLVDAVVDSIFHYGFQIVGGHFLNEDGDQNQQVPVVAGWVDYFLNGVNTVFGSDTADTLKSGRYSAELADAANELWYAGAGDDKVNADEGQDTVWGGLGNDKIDGSYGDDLVYGEDGADILKGSQGNDALFGGAGDDKMDGGSGNDALTGGNGADQMAGAGGADVLDGSAGDDAISGGTEGDSLLGGAGNDKLSGDAGADTVDGGADDDAIAGGDGDDLLLGGAGRDILVGGEGADTVQGGAGADVIRLQDTGHACDVLVFDFGDSGTAANTIDRVTGFEAGVDKIDLTAFAGMTFETAAFSGSGPSSYFYGHVLMIDADGDSVCDMAVGMKMALPLTAGDFLLA